MIFMTLVGVVVCVGYYKYFVTIMSEKKKTTSNNNTFFTSLGNGLLKKVTANSDRY